MPCCVYRGQGTITIIVLKRTDTCPMFTGDWRFPHGGGDSGHGLHKHFRGTELDHGKTDTARALR